MIDTTATFSTEVTDLADATRPDVVALDDGDSYELRIAPVAKNLGDDRVRMLSYNGSIPGPTLWVRQGSEVIVHVRNEGDTAATVHWHGLRLDNAYDGVPFETQPPIEIGGEFTYRLRFPDAGLYWYHPHIREDYGLDMGLYGNIVVEPADPAYWPPVDREVVVTLDDVLVEDGRIAAFHEAGPTHVAMGRFGNVMLTGGETSLALRAQVGEVVRFYFTNTANTRLFNVALPGARMKLIGADSGRYEHETFVDEVLLAPSERAIVDVRFDTPGSTLLEHRTPGRTYTLGTVEVADTDTTAPSTQGFEHLRYERRAGGLAGASRRPHRTPTGQDARLQVTHAAPLRRDRNDRSRLHLPDAPRRRLHRAGNVPTVRHEARSRVDRVRVPDAPRRRLYRAGNVPTVRHEARPCADLVRVPDAPRRHLGHGRRMPEMWDAARSCDAREHRKCAHARAAP